MWHFIKHFMTITRHRHKVMYHCLRCGILWQGMRHDLSKYSPTEFLPGARFYLGDRSPTEGERREYGYSKAWMHHKGRNKHHFEYWVDYGIGAEHVLAGMPMPRKYIAEMIMDRISASRTYHPETYTDASPLEYFLKGKDRLWFIHPDTSAQIEYLLRMLAVKGEEKTLWYIKHVYLKNKGRFGGSGSTYVNPERRVHTEK